MSQIQTSPQLAPEYAYYRKVTAADTLPEQIRAHGINMSGYGKANIQVVPKDNADPTVKVLFWSEEAGKFVDEHEEILKAGAGPNKAYEFTVDCMGRIMFVACTAIGEGEAKIFVSGFDLFTIT